MSRKEIVKDAIAVWKRDVLSPYCLKRCKESCCYLSKGRIITNEAGLKALIGREELDAETLEAHLESPRVRLPLLDDEDEVSAEYFYEEDPCQQFNPQTRRCRIHEDPNRPDVCSFYPVAYVERNFRTSFPHIGAEMNCEAIRDVMKGKFDNGIAKIAQSFGLRIVYY